MKFLVSVLLLSVSASGGQISMKKSLVGKSELSCVEANEKLSQKIDNELKSLNLIRINLGDCYELSFPKPKNFVQSAELEYQVESIKGNF